MIYSDKGMLLDKILCDAIPCVCPLIDHGSRPMKALEFLILLYKFHIEPEGAPSDMSSVKASHSGNDGSIQMVMVTNQYDHHIDLLTLAFLITLEK